MGDTQCQGRSASIALPQKQIELENALADRRDEVEILEDLLNELVD